MRNQDRRQVKQETLGRVIGKVVLVAFFTSLMSVGTTAGFMILQVIPTLEVQIKDMGRRIDVRAVKFDELSRAVNGGEVRPGLKSEVATLQECTRGLKRDVAKLQGDR